MKKTYSLLELFHHTTTEKTPEQVRQTVYRNAEIVTGTVHTIRSKPWIWIVFVICGILLGIGIWINTNSYTETVPPSTPAPIILPASKEDMLFDAIKEVFLTTPIVESGNNITGTNNTTGTNENQ